MPKNLIDELVYAAPNRRSFLKKIATATAAVGALSVAGTRSAEAQSSTEISILQFALNQEYLESEFYSYAVYGRGIETFNIGISGQANGANPTSGGTTVGGAQIDFAADPVLSREIAIQLAADEQAHVALIRLALGGQPIARPNINLNAMGFGMDSQSGFLRLARMLEDVGLSAFNGAIGMFTTPAFIRNTGRIIGTEGQHVGTLRTQGVRLSVPSVPADGADLIPPPSGPHNQYLSVNTSNGLTAVRTPGQVLYIAYGMQANVSRGGFFPDGVNGPITLSSAPATAANLDIEPPPA